MENKNFSNSKSDSPSTPSINASEGLKSLYEPFLAESSKLFPKSIKNWY